MHTHTVDTDATLLLTVSLVTHLTVYALVNSITTEAELHTHTVEIDTTLLLTVNSVTHLTVYTFVYSVTTEAELHTHTVDIRHYTPVNS